MKSTNPDSSRVSENERHRRTHRKKARRARVRRDNGGLDAHPLPFHAHTRSLARSDGVTASLERSKCSNFVSFRLDPFVFVESRTNAFNLSSRARWTRKRQPRQLRWHKISRRFTVRDCTSSNVTARRRQCLKVSPK